VLIELNHLLKAQEPSAPQLFELTQYGVRMPNGREIWSKGPNDPFVNIPGVGHPVRLTGRKIQGEYSVFPDDAAKLANEQLARLSMVSVFPPFVLIERKVTVIVHPTADSERQLTPPTTDKL
jgi:hypothetical protein